MAKACLSILPLAALLSACVAPPPFPGPPPPPDVSAGPQLINNVSGECLDVQGGGAADGTPLILFHCHGSPNQTWTVGHGQIVGIGGSCIDVQGSAAVD